MAKFEDVAPAQEKAIIEAIVNATIELQEKNHKKTKVARRDLHAKSLGVSKAVFKVRDLPENLRVGLFAQPDEYEAVVRFSNGTLGPETPDVVPNVRGMAVKLFGVTGAKLLPGAETSLEHDFVMANHPSFFIKHIEHFLLLTKKQIAELIKESPVTLRELVLATSKLVTSPLDIDYFSQVPYSFGDIACKFAFTHQPGKYGTKLPNFLDKDYLRHSLNDHLRRHSAKFVLSVQFQQEDDSLSDSTKPWSGEMFPLADLTLPRIEANIEESNGEELSFNPYCVLKEHQPLGWPGRLRGEVYAADFKWRSQKNAENLN